MRSAKEWRPSPMLCKRLDIMDPYRGRKAVMSVQVSLELSHDTLGQMVGYDGTNSMRTNHDPLVCFEIH